MDPKLGSHVPRRALVLAAGKGERLRPLTSTVPKPLVEVAGRPLIAHALGWLRHFGVREVAINLHHLGDQIRAAVGDGSAYGVSVHYSEEPEILGTGGAIRQLAGWLADGPFVVANADIVHGVDLAALAELHHASGSLATLALRPDPESARYGEIFIDGTGRIVSFLDEPPRRDELEALMFTGVQIVEPSIVPRIPWPGASSSTAHLYRPLVREGAPLYGLRYDGYWSDAGTPTSLEALRADFAARRVVLGYDLG
ncbi:MAG: NDP-sugar synthase [Deltaproteobacteria bacterium]|nr:NDP-sugar synthase [Deltaproteobacteria bacterium]